MTVQTVDAHLREAAVLAVVLHAQSGHEIEGLRQADGVHGLHGLRSGDGHQRRRLPPKRLFAIRGNGNFIHVQRIMLVVMVRHILSPRTKDYRPEQQCQGVTYMFFHCFDCLLLV